MPDRKRSVFLRIRSAQRSRRTAKPLDGPLTRSNDKTIDAALARHELVRRDLFSNNTITSCYRGRMAEMIAALEVDLDLAITAYWPELKRADAQCASCPHPRACARWFRDTRRATSQVDTFCPNAPLFTRIVADQIDIRRNGQARRRSLAA